jgi:hypothetical protein
MILYLSFGLLYGCNPSDNAEPHLVLQDGSIDSDSGNCLSHSLAIVSLRYSYINESPAILAVVKINCNSVKDKNSSSVYVTSFLLPTVADLSNYKAEIETWT